MSKTNKFTKSIMERLEQEKSKAVIEKKENSNIKNNKNIIEKQKISEKKAEEPKKKEIKNKTIDNIIKKQEERVAKNKTFYLDESVIVELQKEARRLKMTDSKLANEILKSVLNIK